LRKVIIYRIVFPNGKSYIGQTIQPLNRRINRHRSNSANKSCRMYNIPVYNAIRKYGWKSLIINILCKVSKDKANKRETFYIEKFGSLIENRGYNCILEWPDKRKEMSKETRQKMSEIQRTSEKCKAHLKKLHESRKGKKAQNRKKCACYDADGALIKRYDCMMDAKKDGHVMSAISRCCKGKQKTHHKLTWKLT